MFNSVKIPLIFLVTGLFWAIFSDPAITFFTHDFDASYQDLFRNLNDSVFVVIISFVLYFEIKKKEKKLNRSYEEYRQLFESNPNPMWIYNIQSLRIVNVNTAAIEKYAFSRNRFLSMSIHDIRPVDDHEKLENFITESKEGIQAAGIWTHTKGTGENFKVSVVSHPVFFDDQNCKMVMATDITELIEKEKKLQDSYQKIKATNEILMQVSWSNSHELRKPLCSVLGLVNLLKQVTCENERNELIKLLEQSSIELDQISRQNSERVSHLEIQDISSC
jgi:PAS domain S-box-containing protein